MKANQVVGFIIFAIIGDGYIGQVYTAFDKEVTFLGEGERGYAGDSQDTDCEYIPVHY